MFEYTVTIVDAGDFAAEFIFNTYDEAMNCEAAHEAAGYDVFVDHPVDPRYDYCDDIEYMFEPESDDELHLFEEQVEYDHQDHQCHVWMFLNSRSSDYVPF